MGRVSVAFFILCLGISPVNAEWVYGPRDTLTSNDVYDETGPQSLGKDSSDCLHLVWRQKVPEGGWKILYMNKPSEQPWTTPIEIPMIVTNNRIPALAVEPAGFAHVVWDGLSGGDYDIFYSTNKTLIWETIMLTNNPHDDEAPTIARNTAGSVHIAWVGYDTVSSENKIFYATDESGDWVVQMVEESQAPSPPIWADGRLSIAVTPEGIVHITYPDNNGWGGPGRVHHLENFALGGADWVDEGVETDNWNDIYSSISTEANGTLHLAVSGYEGSPPATGYRSYYVSRPAGSAVWDTPQKLSGTGVCSPVLVTDDNGFAYVAGDWRWPGFTPLIRYWSNWQNYEWRGQLVIVTDDYHYCYPSLLIDESNFGHMAYCSNLSYYGSQPPGEIFYTRSEKPLKSAGTFVRGDANADQFITISDGLYIFKHLFLPGTPTPSCVDALDVTDNGNITMQDGIYLLQHLFIPGSPEPPPPFPECGYDPTWEGLGCAESTCEVQ